MEKFRSIAIDGPSGVGKSTLARGLAHELSYVHVDTGAIYRTLAVYFIDHGLSPEDEKGISEAIPDVRVSVGYEEGEQHMLLNGTDVTGRLRTEEVSHMASVSSQYPSVREALIGLQRELAESHDVVMDGRDIGTVVLPDADLKIFLTASPHVRALRRYKELEQKGTLGGATLDDIENDLAARDYRDSHREIAPLRAAEGAVLIDSSDMDIDEVRKMALEAFHAGQAG